MDFSVGDVLQVEWSEHLIRIMMCDEVEVLYDAFYPEIGWNLARARTSTYYRAATHVLRSRGHHIRTEPLTDDELARHRPDLPLRLLRSGQADWGRPLPDWPKIDIDFEIASRRLAIVPFGSKGAPQKAIVVKAANAHSLTAGELLVAAHRIQTVECPEVNGVGVYRSGLSGGIPSYYLWGVVDRAGHAG